MAHCLSNFQISHPISTQTPNSNSSNSKFPKFLNLVGRRQNTHKSISVRAEAGNGRDNLDHLQRAGNKMQQQQQQQQQPIKRRVSQSAPIGLWDRYPTARTVQQMMETMDRLMEDPYGGTWVATVPNETSGYSRGRSPWEIIEAEGEYKMRFDMPGMTKSDVKVWVEEKMLVVKAEKESKENGSGDAENGGVWSAKSYGKYSSRIALPDNIQFEKIKAEVRDGVLYINIPKASPTSKVLDINVG